MKMLEINVKSRVKHLDRKKYWIREYVGNKNVSVKYVDTKNNLADIFTKYVQNTVLDKLRPAIMGREDPPRSEGNDEVVEMDINMVLNKSKSTIRTL